MKRVLAFAIQSPTAMSALTALTRDDPTLRVHADERSGHVIVAGVSERQLQNVIARSGVSSSPFHVIYKQMFNRPADGDGRFVRQSGGHGQFAHVKIHLIPSRPDSAYRFTAETAIPANFITAAEEGIMEELRHALDEFADVGDVTIELYDGSYHDVDSSEAAFKVAGAMALDDAAAKAGRLLMEPVMRVQIGVPADYLGDVMSDVVSREGSVESLDSRDDLQVITARMPLRAMIGYEADLQSRTDQRSTCSIEFDCYQPCNVRPDSDDCSSGVPAPLKPAPRRGGSRVASPEPDEDS